jgi:hypothetical protein
MTFSSLEMYGVLDPDLTPAGTVDSDSESGPQREKAHIKKKLFTSFEEVDVLSGGQSLGNT